MPDEHDMLSAVAAARARRLQARSLRYKAAIALLTVAAASVVGIAWAVHAPSQNVEIAEASTQLSIEDALREAVDDYSDFPEVDWAYWLGINPDIVGWITVPKTAIDYPIVQAKADSPAFYLSHGIDGGDDAKGCVFLDAECELGLDSMHSVMYGHNWNGGLVFADLAKFADLPYAEAHRQMLLQTPAWKTRLAVQCVELANGTDSTNVIRFADAEEMMRWYEARFLASSVKLSEKPEAALDVERIYTFCTCADGAGDKRVLVYAIPSINLRADAREAASTA